MLQSLTQRINNGRLVKCVTLHVENRLAADVAMAVTTSPFQIEVSIEPILERPTRTGPRVPAKIGVKDLCSVHMTPAQAS